MIAGSRRPSTPLDGVLLLAAATAAPSSCVLASDADDSPIHRRHFSDAPLVWGRDGASAAGARRAGHDLLHAVAAGTLVAPSTAGGRSEEHTSELQSLMRISYAVFCLKKK